MKKYLLIFMLIILNIFFVSCQNFDKIIDENVSETNTNYMVGENQMFSVSLLSGQIEEENIKNGVKTNLLDFTSITLVVFGEAFDTEFLLKLGEEKSQFALFKNPFNKTFSITLKRQINCDQLDVTIFYGKNSSKINLKNIIDKTILPLNVFKKEMQKELAEIYFDNQFNGEISVKFLKDYKNDGFYWYVSCTRLDKSYFAIMIDCKTGITLAKKH